MNQNKWYIHDTTKKKDDISLLPSICTILLRYVTKNAKPGMSFYQLSLNFLDYSPLSFLSLKNPNNIHKGISISFHFISFNQRKSKKSKLKGQY